ncbi:PREDICTED: trypsin-1-like [Ceratosolen solmsi marchali]|uniref:Trypsin-1-like n=1 Tax=Ceratosolen solmsi marchali TaxID=326594 RepID=A0AAJ7DUY0_9HYME|nr:PREDICTED: trypsin-1-like [Ceratosolen solmsi marchali]
MANVIDILSIFLLIQGSRAFSVASRVDSNFITQGADAFPGQYPYQVLILHGVPPIVKDIPLCGGSIINNQWILTSGYCVTSIPKIGRAIVKVGKHELRKDSEFVQTSEVLLRIIHKEYGGFFNSIKSHDIGLLKLKTRLRTNNRVHPVKLPKNKNDAKGIGILSGWGSVSKKIIINLPDVLQFAKIPIIKQSNCEDALRVVAPIESISDIQFCSGPLDGRISACIGDSGDPLVQKINGSTVQIGIASWAPYPCGGTGSPTVYTLVSAFVDWINEKIEEN